MADPKRLDLSDPVTVAALQRLLDHPEVSEVHLGKPANAASPVEVGILRKSTLKMAWCYGATLLPAIRLAESALREQKGTVIDEA